MSKITKRKLKVAGYNVTVVNFGYASYYYPDFNGNAEYPVTSKGYRALSHYLRTIKWVDNLTKDILS